MGNRRYFISVGEHKVNSLALKIFGEEMALLFNLRLLRIVITFYELDFKFFLWLGNDSLSW